jgi:hypothetical protein
MIYGIDGSVAYYQFPWQIGFSYLAQRLLIFRTAP